MNILSSDHQTESSRTETPVYPFKKSLSKKAGVLIPMAALCLCSATVLNAATLAERAVYDIEIIPGRIPDGMGGYMLNPETVGSPCSAFDFGDITLPSKSCNNAPSYAGAFEDNFEAESTYPSDPPFLNGGNGVSGDTLAGVIQIETDVADGSGNNTFSLLSFQVDPYLNTAGGTFKTTMTNPPSPTGLTNGGGTVTAAGAMVLDLDGRMGSAIGFHTTLGINPWNIDDSTLPSVTTTGEYEPFVTGTSTADPKGLTPGFSISGRAIGDANTDMILDAVLVSAGNIGQNWGAFDGTQYSEAFNVRFQLVSAKPVANDDTVPAATTPTTTTIDVADLLANDTHAEGDTLALDSLGTTAQAGNGSSIADNSDGTLTYTPPDPDQPSDSFDYTVIDLDSNTHTATVTVLFPSGTPPMIGLDSITLDEDTSSAEFDPVANDSDPETITDNLILFSFDGVSTNAGTITNPSARNLTYTPAANFFGSDDFDYVVHDGDGNLVTGTVNVTVNPVNDPLFCSDVPLNLITSTADTLAISISDDLIATCTEIPGQPGAKLDPSDTFSLVSVQATTDQGGSVSGIGTGTLTYTPPDDFVGTDTFTYTATDGFVSDISTVSVTVGTFGNFTMLDPDGNVFGGTNDVAFEWDGQSFNTDEADDDFGLITIATNKPQPFFGSVWVAHHIRVYECPGPGECTFTFDTTCTVNELESGVSDCNNPLDAANNQTQRFLTMTLQPGQIGAHMLFDWSSSINIDVINVWEPGGVWNDPTGQGDFKNDLWLGAAGQAPDTETTWQLVSTDVNGDGNNGSPMVDGPFLGYYANFNRGPGGTADDPPPFDGQAIDTLLGNGALSWLTLLGIVPLISLLRRWYKNKTRAAVVVNAVCGTAFATSKE